MPLGQNASPRPTSGVQSPVSGGFPMATPNTSAFPEAGPLAPAPRPQKSEFEPFYDRFAQNPLSKVIVSIGLGFIFFLLHWLSLGSQIYRNYGWMLALLIGCAALFQYYATATFRKALPEMKDRLSGE